jgi:elongator complex protein 3
MPNLYGATPASDRADFARFFDDPAIRPDELKIYPCSLIGGTELYDRWQAGDYTPYTLDELVELLVDVKPTIPPYTRINRLFRDIPAHHIEAGVKVSNLRQVVQDELARRGLRCGCIRCREVKRRRVSEEEVELCVHSYDTDLTREHFLHFVTTDAHPEPGLIGQAGPEAIAGFLRLSLPRVSGAGSRAFLDEIADAALIREVHVYGPALGIGAGRDDGQAQHAGLGTQLLDAARRISREAGFRRISVIAATGTRGYYAARGFTQGDLYMSGDL